MSVAVSLPSLNPFVVATAEDDTVARTCEHTRAVVHDTVPVLCSQDQIGVRTDGRWCLGLCTAREEQSLTGVPESPDHYCSAKEERTDDQ